LKSRESKNGKRKSVIEVLSDCRFLILFATDICTADAKLPLAEFLKGLAEEGKSSQEVFDKVARENAIRLLGL
jgi:predicted TIM-barrel fold metal-dependent hydrolase